MCLEFSNAWCLTWFSPFKDFQNQMLHRMYLGQNKVTKPACAVHIIGMDQSVEQLPSTAHYIFYLSAPLIWCHHCTVTRCILGNQYNSFESTCIYYLWFSAQRQICIKVSSPTGYMQLSRRWHTGNWTYFVGNLEGISDHVNDISTYLQNSAPIITIHTTQN